MGNRIDVMAAIGMGQIRVTGLVPLADALGYIFEHPTLHQPEPATLTNSGSTGVQNFERACQSSPAASTGMPHRSNRTGAFPYFAQRAEEPLLDVDSNEYIDLMWLARSTGLSTP